MHTKYIFFFQYFFVLWTMIVDQIDIWRTGNNCGLCAPFREKNEARMEKRSILTSQKKLDMYTITGEYIRELAQYS